MKTIIISGMLCFILSGCCSIFTPSSQPITFVGENGTRIYDFNGEKVATIEENGRTTVQMRKKYNTRHLVAKKEGYKPYNMRLISNLDPLTFLNVLNCGFGFLIDAATQKICKWENTYFDLDMEKEQTHKNPSVIEL